MSRRSTRKACRRNKRAAQFEHARRRAMTRYGIKLTLNMHDRIVSKIYLNGSTLVERQSNRISIHDVSVEGKVYRVVYDNTRKVLVTFLYQDMDGWPSDSSTETKSPRPSPISNHGCNLS